MSFSKLTIENFQSHQSTKLKFHRGVNVLIGDSDCGKSAIIRAFTFVLKNRPSGDAFRSAFTEEATIVELGVDDENNTTITRIKGSENGYVLERHGNDLEEYKGFGTSVPEEVSAALNFDDVNFQGQHDAHFLLSKGSGEVAKTLNRISNLDSIDKAVANIKKRVVSVTKEAEIYASQISDLEEQIKGFKFLPRMERRIEMYEDLNVRQKAAYEAILSVEKTIASAQECILGIETAEKIILAEKEISSLFKMLKQSTAIQNQIEQIGKLTDQVARFENDIKECDEVISFDMQVVVASKESTDIKTIDKIIKEVRKIINSILITQDQIKSIDTKIKTKIEEFDSSFPNICPLCERRVSDES